MDSSCIWSYTLFNFWPTQPFRVGLDHDDSPVWMFEYVNDTECRIEPELNITAVKCGDDELPVNISIDTLVADVSQGYCNLTSVSTLVADISQEYCNLTSVSFFLFWFYTQMHN